MLLQFPGKRWRHGRASKGSPSGTLASIAANVSRVMPVKPRAVAMDTISSHQCEGRPRARQELTVDALSPNAAATPPVPPKASMILSTVSNMDSFIVRKLRTRQVFATRETLFGVDCGGILAMADSVKTIAKRLLRTRLALGYQNQAEYCRQIHVGKNTYNPFETGQRRISIDVALKIRARFGVPLDWIYCGDPRHLDGTIYQKLDPVA